MEVNLDPQGFQPASECICRRLSGELCDDNAADIQTDCAECVDEAEHIDIISDPEVTAGLVFFDVRGVDNDYDFCALFELEQHFDFAVRGKPGQHPRGVEIIE